MEFDPLADGPMRSWLVGCLRERLGEMLSRAGAGDVAASWDPRVHTEVLEAVARVPDVYLGIAGDGPLRKALAALSEKRTQIPFCGEPAESTLWTGAS